MKAILNNNSGTDFWDKYFIQSDYESKFYSLFKHAAEGIILADEENNVIDINIAGMEILGAGKSKLLGANFWNIFYNNHKLCKMNGIEILENEGILKRRCTIRKGNGEEILIEISVRKFMQGQIHAMLRDVTKQADIEKRINELAKFTEENPNPVMRIDKKGVLLFSNTSSDNLLEFLKWEVEEIIPDLWIDRIQQVLDSNRKTEYEVPINDQVFQFVLVPVKENGFVNIYGSNITDLVNTREKALESDRLKSAFLATISHELRTPLNAVIGFSELINEKTEMQEVLEFKEMINESGKNLLSIIEDILSLSQIDDEGVKLRRQTFRLSDLFIETKAIFDTLVQQTHNSHLDIIYKPQLDLINSHLRSDKFKIRQVLIHLFKNALKFTKQGVVEVGFYTKNDKDLIFYIKDTGIGIATDKQQYIFDYFRQVDDTNTRAHGGIGIGLSIANTVTQALDGNIELESEEGKGSTFTIILKDIFENTGRN